MLWGLVIFNFEVNKKVGLYIDTNWTLQSGGGTSYIITKITAIRISHLMQATPARLEIARLVQRSIVHSSLIYIRTKRVVLISLEHKFISNVTGKRHIILGGVFFKLLF